MTSATDAAKIGVELSERGVRGVVLYWADNNGILRVRLVDVDRLERVARRGLGASVLLAVFDTHDAVARGYEGLATASGDRRVLPDLDAVRQLGSEPTLAFAPVDQYRADGTRSEYDPRHALQRQLDRAARAGIDFRVGYELEFTVFRADDLTPAHHGPAYSAQALADLGDFPTALLDAFARTGIAADQIHAEYSSGQLEISLAATDPLRAADDHLLSRHLIHSVARAHGLRVSFAPLTALDRAGNGAHVHISPWRDGVNLLTPTATASDIHGLGRGGAHFLAGLLREVAALTTVAAPSVPSLRRLRPGYFVGSYTFWGVENRDAVLRLAEGGPLLGDSYWNIEFRASDASGNPYLVLAALIASGLAGLAEELDLPAPIADDPHQWTLAQRDARAVTALPFTADAADAALDAAPTVRSIFTPEHREAFRVVRASDARWASERTDEEVVAEHLWRY
ncbi:glutamine synthetase family protein [Nocardia sp. NPDC050717]|uniref:glutamine synthetase family protein n=1 Tax=Nocardia sp. NPDC050717 TaxID=3157221 RepID=UPI0033F74968